MSKQTPLRNKKISYYRNEESKNDNDDIGKYPELHARMIFPSLISIIRSEFPAKSGS